MRTRLIALLPRLRRFATVLAGEREGADTLLRAACKKMLGSGHTYRQGTPFDVWAFGVLHEKWLEGLRSRAAPISQGGADASVFVLAHGAGAEDHAGEAAEILARLPPQQRSAVLLVYGEGFSYEDAAAILDTERQTVIARVARALASFIERAPWLDSERLGGGEVEQLRQASR